MTPEFSPCQLSIAAERTRVLLGCYRRGDAEDPEIYIRAVAAVFTRYPEAVVRKVSDPVRGLPSSSKWLPTVAEVRAACDEEMGPVYRKQERERRAGETFLQLAAPTVTPEERARAVEHWEKEVRPAMAQRGEEKPKETPEEALARLHDPKSPLKAPVVVGKELAAKLFAMRQESKGAA